MTEKPLSIIGSGSWGTALAMAASRNGVPTLLWGPEPEQLITLENERCNQQYLGDYPFPESLTICHEFEDAVTDAEVLLLAVPSHVFADVMTRIKPLLTSQVIAWATKGLDPTTDRFPSDIVAELIGPDWPMAVLSGPSFAKEVARGLPTAVVVAANQESAGQQMRKFFQHELFQIDLSDDLVGVQLGGAAKNVIAIATGIADSIDPSANTRAAIITRGLQEIQRLGLALGAKAETFYGLSGMGDLVLTCSDDQSRNRRFGLALGRGQSCEEALASIGQVVEGLTNVDQVIQLAQKYAVVMPIASLVKGLLNGEISPEKARIQMLSA